MRNIIRLHTERESVSAGVRGQLGSAHIVQSDQCLSLAEGEWVYIQRR